MFCKIIACDTASYAEYTIIPPISLHNNTQYKFDFSLDNVRNNLEKYTNSLLNFFRKLHLKANDDKYHLLVNSDKCSKLNFFNIDQLLLL